MAELTRTCAKIEEIRGPKSKTCSLRLPVGLAVLHGSRMHQRGQKQQLHDTNHFLIALPLADAIPNDLVMMYLNECHAALYPCLA